MRIAIKVKPGASRPGISLVSDGEYVVSVSAKPTRGGANKDVIDILSNHFKVAKSSIDIVRGFKSKNKIVEIKL